jgi:hypothetical protein
MNVMYYAVTILTIVANAYATAADIFKVKFVMKTMREVGVNESALPLLAACKGLAVVGLIGGLLGLRALGIAAAAGLVVFFIGAVIAHLRARVYYNIAFPLTFLALAVATLVTSIDHA